MSGTALFSLHTQQSEKKLVLQVEVPVFKHYLVPTLEAQGMQVTADKDTNDAMLIILNESSWLMYQSKSC